MLEFWLQKFYQSIQVYPSKVDAKYGTKVFRSFTRNALLSHAQGIFGRKICERDRINKKK